MTSETMASPGNRQEATLESLLNSFYDLKASKKSVVHSCFHDLPDEQAFPALEQALRNNENANQRNAAMETYVFLGNRSIPYLRALLKDKDEEIRTFAGVVLGNMRHPDAVPDLLSALIDPDLNVKHAAAEALSKIRDPRAVKPLIEALSADMWLQFPAAVALGELGDCRAVQPLLALLDMPGANVPAIQALGRIGDLSALVPLCAFLEDEEPSLREWALDAVAGIITKHPDAPVSISLPDKAGRFLIETLRSNSLKARRNAAMALGFFRIGKAVSALNGVLPDADMREDAQEALLRITGKGVFVGAAPQASAWTAESHACDPADIIPLRDFISEQLGLYFDDDRLHVLHHRLSPLAVSGGHRSFREYHRHLVSAQGRDNLLAGIASRLTNNETYFFREMEQLTAFIASLLPELIKRSGERHRKLRMLSAGCSSGEEAYTLAMLIEETGIRALGCEVEISGMDIDAASLEIAAQSRYPVRSFRQGENGFVKKYFRGDDGGFLVNENIRKMVRFRRGNVLDASDGEGFDVIFCRNVLIYFSDASVQRAAENFHRMLTPGGYLLLGHAETLCRIRTDFAPVRLAGVVAYQKL